MNKKHLEDAMDAISDKHLQEAAAYKKRTLAPYMSAIAACLALAVLFGFAAHFIPKSTGEPVPGFSSSGQLLPPISPRPYPGNQDNPPLSPFSPGVAGGKYVLAAPKYPEMVLYPTNMQDSAAYLSWYNSNKKQYNQPRGYAKDLAATFAQRIPDLFSEDDENAVFSPLNIYIAMAMVAETAQGQSQKQILDAFGVASIEALRTLTNQVWNGHYRNDGATTSLLANSLWLQDGLKVDSSIAQILANNYFASTYQGNLQSTQMEEALHDWLNTNTNGLLKDYVQNESFDDSTVLALASTIYYKARWANPFWEKNNVIAPFHAPGGSEDATFMRTTLSHGTYYWGEDYSAVYLDMENAGGMWLILPDEGKTPHQILQSGNALNMILKDETAQSKSLKINLFMPKFDISAQTGLKTALNKWGIYDVFGKNADFSAFLENVDGIFLSDARHTARIIVDEEGVEAAAYTMIVYAGAAEPPSNEIDFVLDRPFVFLLESEDGLPLFTGIVNNP